MPSLPPRKLEHFPFVKLKQVFGPLGSGANSAPCTMEYMRFRDMSQVTGTQKVRMEAGLRDLRLRPNREPSRHLALR